MCGLVSGSGYRFAHGAGTAGSLAASASPEKNRWYCIEQQVRLKQPERNDGLLRAWVEVRLAFEKTDIRFRTVAALKIEQVWMNVYHGGTKPSPYDQHRYIDNVVIARKYIGPRR